MSDLVALAKPFRSEDVQQKPGGAGGDYVKHSTVTEKLLYDLGPFTTRVVQVVYDGDVLTGVVLALTVTIDGREVTVTEAGDNENPTAKTNGARLKDAMSDAIKRCAMRLGVGLHLWSQESYRLHGALEKREQSGPSVGPVNAASALPVDGGGGSEAQEPETSEATGQVESPGVVELPPPSPSQHGEGNDTESESGQSVADGVVREPEPARTGGGGGVPSAAAPNPIAQARKAAR